MRILVIADTQMPFEHPDYLLFLKNVQARYNTTETIHVGDELDFHAMSDYDPDPDGYGPGHEILAAIEKLKPYYKAFPKMKLCHSNHGARILKKAFKARIPKVCLREFKEVIEAPRDWHWADSWELDGVRFLHGMGYSGTMGALNAAIDFHQPCVIGHLHSDAGILYRSNGREEIWGMNVGSGIDPAQYAFKYGKDSRKKSIISCGVVIDGEPQLISMRGYKSGK